MPGPNKAAGLKMGLHQRDDLISIKDHGFAVPPGSQALVAARVMQVLTLNLCDV